MHIHSSESHIHEKEKLVTVVGPTASGKTAVAISLAQRIGGEIVSADSMQVYRGMDIGTAKATPAEMDAVPHHLIDILNPSEPFSVAEYQRIARKTITAITRRGNVPILVGGTGLYVRAVIDNLKFPSGETTSEVRKQLEERAGKEGGDALYQELIAKDPASIDIVHPHNIRRVIRALEVIELTGQPFSEYQREWGNRESIYNVAMYGFTLDRSLLRQRINERVDMMIARGLIDEVAGLVAEGYENFLTSQQAIGYKELIGYLQGGISLEDAIETIKAKTRQYAKRQLTWFNADPRVQWIDTAGRSANDVVSNILSDLKANGFIRQRHT
ncbi:MAG TPA: tRNA (adenosine(37)-N6)-dimethylallyltransferase MiaA [Candidatus Aquicultor sp.]|jgi:tRNA dimethylallyltransferase